jgi:hypothetical protein
MSSSLLFSSKILDNHALIPIFNRLKKIRILTDQMNISSKYALKFVQHFPSLTIVEMEVYSIYLVEDIVDIFLSGLAKLHLIVIQSQYNSLSVYSFSREHIIHKRRQSFGLSKHNENKIGIKIEDQTWYIRVA